MKVIEMVAEHLKLKGFDGLFSDECGCRLSGLAPCGEIGLDCRAGYVHKHSVNDEWFVVKASKEPLSDQQIEDWPVND